MRRLWSCLFCGLFVIAGTIAGFFLGMRGPEWVDAGLLNYWRSFHLPDRSKAVRFLELMDHHLIPVETNEDDVFLLPLSFDETPTWILADEEGQQRQLPKVEGYGECRAEKPYREGLIILPHFRTEMDRIYCRYSLHAEYGGDMIFMIDNKGGVYRWLNKDLGYGGLFWFPICGIGGAVLGAIIGWFIYSRMPWRTSKQTLEGERTKDRWQL